MLCSEHFNYNFCGGLANLLISVEMLVLLLSLLCVTALADNVVEVDVDAEGKFSKCLIMFETKLVQ